MIAFSEWSSCWLSKAAFTAAAAMFGVAILVSAEIFCGVAGASLRTLPRFSSPNHWYWLGTEFTALIALSIRRAG